MKAGPLARTLLDFFLPVACLGCGARLPLDRPDDLVCVNCIGRLRPPPAPRCPRCNIPLGTARSENRPCTECVDWPGFVTGARSAVVLESTASTLVHAFKYEGWRELAAPMGARMSALLRGPVFPPPPASEPWLPEGGAREGGTREGGTPPIVVAVPTTARRERHRGYNQAQLLAQVVAARNDFLLVPVLERSGESRTQVALHAAERLANVRRAFSIRPEEASRLRGADVILVDDVLTTGATALAAAYALHSGGVERVMIVTFGRALPARDPRSPAAG